MGPHTAIEWTDFYHCQAFSTHVSGVEMTVLGHYTSPNPWDRFTPNPNDMESQEVYNSVPRQQGTGDDSHSRDTWPAKLWLNGAADSGAGPSHPGLHHSFN